jgi:TolB protein
MTVAADTPGGPRGRRLQPGQRCVVSTYDVGTRETTTAWESDALLVEAPNWVEPDVLVVNGDGVLWRLDLTTGDARRIEIEGVPALNNDHVASVLNDVMYVSAQDWHIYRAPLRGGAGVRVTHDDPARPMRHFLHGVSPDGSELAFVGVEPDAHGPWGTASIFTVPAIGGPYRQLTTGDRPADGCEYSPDGEYIYFNTEAFTAVAGHAQCARMRVDGSDVTQLTFDARVNWFPHIAPNGHDAVYLSYGPGTVGHPENRPVELRLVQDGDWDRPETVVELFGGQGTINVNSWSPDSSAFAFVAYPIG